MRRRSGELRASTHDVVVPTTTHIATKTPTTARRTSGAIVLVLQVQDPPDPENADDLQGYAHHDHLYTEGIISQQPNVLRGQDEQHGRGDRRQRHQNSPGDSAMRADGANLTFDFEAVANHRGQFVEHL